MLKLSIAIIIVAAVLIGGAAIMPILYDGSGQSTIHSSTNRYGNSEPYSQRVSAYTADCFFWCSVGWRDVTLDNDNPGYLARSASGVLIVAGVIAVVGAGAFIYKSAKKRAQRL